MIHSVESSSLLLAWAGSVPDCSSSDTRAMTLDSGRAREVLWSVKVVDEDARVGWLFGEEHMSRRPFNDERCVVGGEEEGARAKPSPLLVPWWRRGTAVGEEECLEVVWTLALFWRMAWLWALVSLVVWEKLLGAYAHSVRPGVLAQPTATYPPSYRTRRQPAGCR